MNTYVKSGFAAAVVGLGVLAIGGSAYAAPAPSPASGCPAAQATYSLTEHGRAIRHDIRVARADAMRCDVAATNKPVAKVMPKAPVAPVQAAAAQFDDPQSIHEHSPL